MVTILRFYNDNFYFSTLNMDIPCNLLSLLKVRDGKLEWNQINRSNDLFLGIPHNIVQFTFLQEILAGWLNLEVGNYYHMSDSLHLYDVNKSKVTKLENIPVEKNTDIFNESKNKSEEYFALLEDLVDYAIDNTSARTKYNELLSQDLPEAYLNILRVLLSELCRRRRDVEMAHKIIHSCTNPVYGQLWFGWMSRIRKRMKK